MANPSVVSKALIAGVSNGICQAQTPGGAGALTLNGSLVSGGVATMDSQRRVVIVSTSGSDAGVTFTVTGTNQGGAPISETITGVTTVAVQSKLDYLTVTGVTSSAGTTGAITVGTNSVGSSPWVVDDYWATVFALAVAVEVGPGSVTCSVEHTYSDPNAQPDSTYVDANWSNEPASSRPPVAFPNPTLTSISANGEAQYANWPIFAHRLTINSGTGTATMRSIQSGIGSR